jgi:hypothetical protein
LRRPIETAALTRHKCNPFGVGQVNGKALVNADITDMLGAGLSPEIVTAKTATSTCEFDTSPAALKALKTRNVPGSVILAMVQDPAGVRKEECRPRSLLNLPPSVANSRIMSRSFSRRQLN